MKEVSNNVLIAVMALALVITIAGVYISMNKISEFGDALGGFTGAATVTGTSELTITSQTQITNQVASINFSSGTVNGTCTECVMDSDEGQQNTTATNDDSGDCCLSFENVSEGFLIENTGNENVTVNFTCAGECTAAEFIGGTNPAYQIKSTANSVAQQANESSALDTVTSCDGQLNGTYKDMIGNGVAQGWYFCGPNGTSQENNYTFSPAADRDAFVIDLNVSIPSDAVAGVTNTSTFTFTAESQG